MLAPAAQKDSRSDDELVPAQQAGQRSQRWKDDLGRNPHGCCRGKIPDQADDDQQRRSGERELKLSLRESPGVFRDGIAGIVAAHRQPAP